MLNKIFAFVVLIIVTSSCTNKLVIRNKNLKQDFSELMTYMKEHEFTFDTYSIKYTGKFESDDASFRFRGILRINKDKEIWISIAPVGVEAARLLFTPTEIKFMSRQNSSFFIGDYNYFQKKFDVDIDYSLLEQILTTKFLFVGRDTNSNVNLTEEGLFLVEDTTGLNTLTYKIHPSLRKLTSVVFNSNSKSTFTVDFADFVDVESQKLPETIKIKVQKDNITHFVELNYKKITVNKKVATPFRIPGKYEQIWP